MLTGKQFCDKHIVDFPLYMKVDDGMTPSYGMDGMGYTLRGNLITDTVIEPGKILRMKSHDNIVMPLNCGGMLYIKSTYARRDLILITNSPVDPGYHGKLSLNLFNAGEYPVTVSCLGGIAMMVVWELGTEVSAYEGRWQHG